MSVGLVLVLALGCGGGADGPRDLADNTSGSGSLTAGSNPGSAGRES